MISMFCTFRRKRKGDIFEKKNFVKMKHYYIEKKRVCFPLFHNRDKRFFFFRGYFFT